MKSMMKLLMGALMLATFALSSWSSVSFAQEDGAMMTEGADSQAYAAPFDFYQMRGRVTCAAYDTGWEEHFGGHSSCGACLSKHGECVEVCSAQQYECTATGTDRMGRTSSYTATAPDRRSAEMSAINACYRRASNCRVDSCDTREEQVSRRSCR